MYAVSNAYKADMKRPVQRFGVRGTVGDVSFTSDNVLQGTFSITNQCTDNDELILGAAYVGELQASFRGLDIDRYDWVGRVITPIHIRYLPDNTTEEVPLGVYTIQEAVWSREGVSVTAYDNMSKLDKTASFNVTSGSAYGILSTICSACDLTFGMTQNEVEALTNGSNNWQLFPQSDIETYRDMIAWLAQAMCAVVIVDRLGRIVLKSYGTDSIDTLQATNRFESSTFADYVSRYSGLSVVDMANNSTRYYHVQNDAYLTMNLGSNPWLQYNTGTLCQNIINKLATAQYVPFTATLLGDPAYDLTDVITNAGGLGDGTKLYCIQKYSWSLSGGYSIEGVGKDPRLSSAKSKTDKNLEGLANKINSNEIQYYVFRNTDEITIGRNEEKQIINIRFTSLVATTVIMHAEVLLDVSTYNQDIDYYDAVGTISYYINGTKDNTYTPIETWVDGDHILHLMYLMNLTSSQLNTLVARLSMVGGSVTIPPMGVSAVIYGQGLLATDKWDGQLFLLEDMSNVSASLNDTLTASADFDEDVTITYYNATFDTITDDMSNVSATLGGIFGTIDMTETLEVTTE